MGESSLFLRVERYFPPDVTAGQRGAIPGAQEKRRPQGRLFPRVTPTGALLASPVVVVVAIVVVAVARDRVLAETDFFRVAAQLEEVEPGAVAVSGVDDAAIVDLDVVGHVAVGLGSVGVALRNVKGDLLRPLRLADVPRADATGEVREERDPPVVGVAEVLFARVHAVARSAFAVI